MKNKCSDIVLSKLEERQEDLRVLFADPDSDEYFDDPALGIDEKELTVITLSYGGPADYLEVTHLGADVESVTYRYSDWFDTATVSVQEDTPLYKYATYVIECNNERIG